MRTNRSGDRNDLVHAQLLHCYPAQQRAPAATLTASFRVSKSHRAVIASRSEPICQLQTGLILKDIGDNPDVMGIRTTHTFIAAM
jgi:hypothetical protein